MTPKGVVILVSSILTAFIGVFVKTWWSSSERIAVLETKNIHLKSTVDSQEKKIMKIADLAARCSAKQNVIELEIKQLKRSLDYFNDY